MSEHITHTDALTARIARAVVNDCEYDQLMDYYVGRLNPRVEEEFDESLVRLIACAVDKVTRQDSAGQVIESIVAYNEGISAGFDIGYDIGRAATEAEFNGRTEL